MPLPIAVFLAVNLICCQISVCKCVQKCKNKTEQVKKKQDESKMA